MRPRVKAAVRGLFPIVKWLPSYSLNFLQCDFIAGVTIGMMVVPQALAYASLAGFKDNVQYGLYASFIGPLLYIVFGSAKDITLGPTAIMSLLVSSLAGDANGNTALGDAVLLSFMAGIIQILLGALRLGFLVDFISFPVISGFTSSAAITIVFSELKHVLGLHNIRQSFAYCVYDTFAALPNTRIWDLALGLVCILALLLLQEFSKWYGGGKSRLSRTIWLVGTARNAIVVIVTGFIAYAATRAGAGSSLTLIGSLPNGMPAANAPDISKDRLQHFIGPAFTVALIAFLESIAIGKAFARQNSYEVDASQELIAIGACNLFSSFFGGYPVTGSFSRTAVNSASGVKTPMGGLYTGTIVIFSLLFLTGLFKYIPQAALGAIIITAVIPMIDYKLPGSILRLNKWDIVPYAVSFFGCLFLDIQYGIAMAVGVSQLYLLYHVARPDHRLVGFESRASALVQQENELTVERVDVSEDVMVFRFGGSLLYPAMSSTKAMVLDLQAAQRSRAVVFDFTCCTSMDYTGCQAMKELVHDLEARGVKMLASFVPPSIAQVLGKGMLLSAISVYSNTTQAVARARQSAPSSSSDDTDTDDQHAALVGRDAPGIQARWTYAPATRS